MLLSQPTRALSWDSLATMHVLFQTCRLCSTHWMLCWPKECNNAFCEAKEQPASKSVLTHYNPMLPVILDCDASPYGMGAVLSHKLQSGEEKLITFASRTLSKAVQNYAQIEWEALGIIFWVRHFHSYLYGRHFNLLTDHHPLTIILSPSKVTPSMAAATLQLGTPNGSAQLHHQVSACHWPWNCWRFVPSANSRAP